MNRGLLNPSAENDFDFEGGAQPRVPSRRKSHLSNYQFQWWHAAVAILILFPYISIFVLFGLVSNQSNTTKNYYTDQTAVVTNFGGKTLPTTQVGVGVSFDSTGNLQVGAGTTLYKNIVDVYAACPNYLSMAAMNSQFYLFSYANKELSNSTLQLVKVSSTNINSAAVVTILPTDYFIYEVVALSSTSSSGIFVAICQDFSSTASDAYVLVGSVSFQTNAVSLSPNKVLYSSGAYSVSPQLIALSSTSFALAYYTGSPPLAETRYGTIDATSLTPTLSDSFFFANDSTNSTYFNLAALTAQTYALFYYDAVYRDGADQPGLLHGLLASVSLGAGPTAATASLSFGNVSVLSASPISDNFAATTLDNATVALAFVDAAQNNAVVVQTATTLAADSTELVFGPSWLVNSGAAYQQLPTGLLDLDIEVISDSRQFVVLYSDLSNQGAVLASVGQLTESNALVRASPDFLLAGPSDVLSVKTWGAVAAGQTESDDSQTALLVLQTSGNCEKAASASFSMLQRLPAPVGVSAGSQGVAVSGPLSGLSGLSAGRRYYTNTKGALVASPVFSGQLPSVPGAGLDAQAQLLYLYDSAENAYVTLESQAGLATAADSLLVQPAAL